MQKVYIDTDRTIILWDMGPCGHTLTFTEDALVDAGFPSGTGGIVNILDLQEVFKCNVTVETSKKSTVRYNEKE